jgi:Tfp pilus assembly protein PilZ
MVQVQRRRRDTRYCIEFPVQLVHARRANSLMTHDVSEGGVFLKTETPPPLLHLVKVHLVLPIGGHALTAHGMTVHVVDASSTGTSGRPAGIGVQFYALDSATRDAWISFARHVASHCPESPDQTPLRLVRGMTPEPLSRRFGNHTAVVDWKPASLDVLQDVYTQEIAQGTLLIPTDVAPPAGANIVVHLRHPLSGAPFLFEAHVLRHTDTPRGVRVELRGADRGFREEFLDFVRGPIVVEEESVA